MPYRPRVFFFSFVLVFSLFAFLFFGSELFPLSEYFDKGSSAHRILTELRWPRLIVVLWIGGSLAALGGTYQTLFHNPLAEPYFLGVSSAVTLGIAISEVWCGLAPYSWQGFLFGGTAALLATFCLLWIYLTRCTADLNRLILFGMGLNFVLSSSVFLLLSYHAQQMGGGSLRWIFGQIPYLSEKESLFLVAICSPFFFAILLLGRSLDALSLGDSVARTVGTSPRVMRAILLVLTSLYISLLVGFSGAVGFVGLVVPHAIRLTLRPDSSRSVFLWSFGWGAIFLLISDLVSRQLLPPFEFPIGILTTLIGGPLFLVLLWKK